MRQGWPLLLVLIRPFENGDAQSGDAARLGQRPDRIVGLVENMAQEHQVK